MVTAKAKGNATITATATANTAKKAVCTITVQNVADGYFKAAGTYRVGTDIPAGEYIMLVDANAFIPLGSYEVTTAPNAQIGTPEFLYNGNFSTRRYILVNSGELGRAIEEKLGQRP